MKTVQIYTLFLMLFISMGIYAQTTVSGIVTEQETGTPLPGVNVFVKGTTNGTTTDFDGNYELTTENGSTLVFSYIGFQTAEIVVTSENIDVALEEDREQLDEVVVIGYGAVRRSDATGSVTSVTSEQFNKGPVISTDQLIQGKVAGVQIINGGGAPGEGSQIRIRSGSSLSAGNDPLYVIDGVPVENGGGGIKGGVNPLATINQNDIESINILKDASATAIYGSRASNGVVIITTKKGREGDLKVSYNSFYSVGTLSEKVDVLSPDQFREYVNTNGNTNQIALLGDVNTDWQDEIYRTAFGTDHNISLSGGNEHIIYRVSTSYGDLNGLLKEDNMKRVNTSVGLTFNLLDDHLKVDLNNNTAVIKRNYSEASAIGSAVRFNPTVPVYAENNYGGYFQWLEAGGNPLQLAGKNPVSLIEQKHNFGRSFRSIGNIQFDYKMHFLPELKAILNLGYDSLSGVEHGYNDEDFAGSDRGNTKNNLEGKENKVLDAYLNYNKTFDAISTNVEVIAGYAYQDFRNSFENSSVVGGVPEGNAGNTRLNLQSFFGRTNISVLDKYLLTLSIRRDGSSRFTKENRWGNFPAAALAWKLNEENFLKNSSTINQLKLRVSWGITGQQDISTDVYPSLPLYAPSTSTAGYQIGYDTDGNPVFVSTSRPEPYNPNLVWEETETINLGMDFGLFDNRITGSIDLYERNTTDLIVQTANPQGVGFSNEDFYNIGDLVNKGIEIAADVYPISNDKITWRIGGNITIQDSEITKLTLVSDPSYNGIDVEDIDGATGNRIQNHQVGYSPFSFYVFEQAYDANGYPLEGVYIDRNQDGIVNADDKYRYKKRTADVFYGFNTNLDYKNWSLNMQWRGSYGNYLYNNVASNNGYGFNMLIRDTDIYNGVSDVLVTDFQQAQLLSDYYVQDASFLKLDNISLSYRFNDFITEGTNLLLTGSVQNVLTLTNYDGLDPEINSGVDKNLYPRPRTFMLGLNVNF